eukprot:9950869-Alexandrium_andersonii.AAC.2
MRLHDMQKWSQSWQLRQHFAGCKGVGAQDAWFEASASLEWAQESERPVLATSLDLYKCFDQLNRGV